jgi:hypothetical protein
LPGVLLVCSLLSSCHFVQAGAPAGRDTDTTLPQIIENIRQNELLYENREVIGEMTFELLRPVPQGFEDMDLAEAREEFRHVGQQGMIYFQVNGYQKTMKSEHITDALQGYDGEKTTTYEQRQAAVIRHGTRFEDIRILRPHALLLYSEFVGFPLSTFLKGEKAILAHPNGGGFKQHRIRPTYVGDEEALGFTCHKISIDLLWSWKGEEPKEVTARRVLWIAPERNYLPVKQVAYTLNISPDKPLEEAVVEELREVVPGVWFPYRTVLTGYDHEIMARQQRPLLAWRRTWTIKQASLDPEYDISLFRDIPIPDGTPVREYANDLFVRKYLQGRPLTASSPNGGPQEVVVGSSLARWALFVVSAGLLLGFLVLRVLYRSVRRARSADATQ